MASLGKNLTQIHRLKMAYFKPIFDPYDISPTSFSILINIHKEPGLSQKQLCDYTKMDEALMTRLINKLISKDLIYKKRNSQDLRAYKIYLTDKGLTLIPQIEEKIHTWWEYLLQGLPEDLLNECIETMTNRAIELTQGVK